MGMNAPRSNSIHTGMAFGRSSVPTGRYERAAVVLEYSSTLISEHNEIRKDRVDMVNE